VSVLATQARKIKHPSWRVYKAAQDCGLDVKDFGLKTDIDVFMPYTTNDDLTNELCKALTDTSYVDSTYEIQSCLELFMSAPDRQLIEAMLLNNKSLAEVCDTISCSDVFAMTYSSLFFDTSIFKNNVEKMIYVREGTCGDDAVHKKVAINKGDEYFKVKQGVSGTKINMDTILADTFAKAYMAMNQNADIDDVSSQEIAQGWGNLMLKIAQHMSKNGDKDVGLDQLVIALQTAAAPKRSIDSLD
jgi:L-rhamnose mutarotase